MITWSLVYYLSEWAVRLVMLMVVTRRRHPSAAMAWLLVIFFLPWPGLVLYLLIGENYLPRRRAEKHAVLQKKLEAFQRIITNHANAVHPQLGPEAEAAVKLAERLGSLPILGGNAVELIARTEEVIDRMVADIDAAERHVHLLFFIFADDETGRRVAEALIRATTRGVKCRVVADAVGSRSMFHTLGPRLKESGVELRPALPVHPFRRHAARLDLRNHRKIAVIDGRIAYSGSQNIVNAGYGHKDLIWRDLMVRLRGPVVLELQAVFASDWYFETDELLDRAEFFPDPEPAGAIPVQTLPSGPNYPTENYHRMVVAALHAAQRQVIITTPYFVPDDAFLQAMQTAVLRGVTVELIVPSRNNLRLVGAAAEAYFDELLDAGVIIHRYTQGLLHTKAMSIDDAIAFIGTSNFDIRSFALNFEVSLLFYGAEVVGELRAKQQEYIADSVQVVQAQWRQRPRRQQVFQSIAKLVSPLL